MSESNEIQTKKARLDDTNLVNILNQFKLVKVLNDNNQSKLMIIQAEKIKAETNGESNGNEEKTEMAVIILEKPHFSTEETKAHLEQNYPFDINIDNDIYKKLSVYAEKPFNNVQVQLIYPATDAHIIKYSAQELFFLEESYQDYLDITLKYIQDGSFSLQWVYNILEHKSEQERIIFEDPDPVNGFVLLPDMKWDNQVDNLYLLAITHQKDIKSIRDLNASNLDLLENIRDKTLATLESKYNLHRSKIRAYFHYQPSFYHLHIHFAHIKFQPPGIPERNFQLNQVINNIKLDPSYYEKASLQFVVRKSEKLYSLYKDRFETN